MPILSEKERLLRKIQACSFALVEANLYLDSHPTCRDGKQAPPSTAAKATAPSRPPA